MPDQQFQDNRQDLKECQEEITTIEDHGNMIIDNQIKSENLDERGEKGELKI